MARPGFVFDFLLLPIATVVFWLLTPEDNSEEAAAAVGSLLGGDWLGMVDFDGCSVADGGTVDPSTRHSDPPCTRRKWFLEWRFSLLCNFAEERSLIKYISFLRFLLTHQS